MTDLVKGMSGGTKQKWLRLHREEVLAYLEHFGEVATRAKYNIRKQETWDRLLSPNTLQPKTKFTKADKAIMRAEIAEAGLREVRSEVRDLKEQYGRFVPFLADEITRKFFVPLLSGKVELPAELEYKPVPDPLSMANFQGRLGK